MYLVTLSLPAANVLLTAKGGEQDPPHGETHRRSPRRLLGLKHRGPDVLCVEAPCGGFSRSLLNQGFKVEMGNKIARPEISSVTLP